MTDRGAAVFAAGGHVAGAAVTLYGRAGGGEDGQSRLLHFLVRHEHAAVFLRLRAGFKPA